MSGVDETMYNAYRKHLNDILDMSLFDLFDLLDLLVSPSDDDYQQADGRDN